MARLILSMDGLVLKEIPLNKERITIGRKPHNDIQIDNLAISGDHAAVVTILDDSFLEDLNSTNGTLVNGQPIKRHVLKNNDVVELGKYKLKYMTEAAVADNAAALRAAGIPAAPEPERTFSDTQIMIPRPPAPDPLPPPQVTVRLLTGPNAGKVLELIKTLTTLGKPGVQVAVIARRPEGVFVTHVEGESFPTVNGRELGGDAYPLKNRDVVEIAGIRMELTITG
ncbi:FHA domain-containing protein [Dechloromonas sp. H13]|uniref:FHA domain-containing protein n=1 Tax=Dechloromonas sp. H13 TaxID=2570193 RepID=UPI0012929BA7|nr:FHA domain-containing protein [Dechloromonas sp. H13]